MRLSTASLMGAFGCTAGIVAFGSGTLGWLDIFASDYFTTANEQFVIQAYYYLLSNILGTAGALALLAFFTQLYLQKR